MTSERDIYARIAAHELSHFFLHSYTPYGLFLSEIAITQSRLVRRYINYYQHEIQKKIFFPIYFFAKGIKKLAGLTHVEKFEINKLIRRYIKPWADMCYLENIFEGRNLLSVQKANQDDAIKALIAIEGMMFEEFNELIKPIGVNTCFNSCGTSVCPVINIKQRDYYFGAKHIIESIATNEEWITHESMKALVGSQQLQVYAGPYLCVIDKYLKVHRGTLGNNDYKIIDNTFAALAELSLFTPIGYYYSPLRNANMKWGDIHPGYRFLKALDITVKANIWVLKSEDIAVFQGNICDVLDWTRPELFLEKGSELDGKLFKEYKKHKAACLIKLSHKEAFIDLENKHRNSNKLLDEEIRYFLSHYLPNMIIDGELRLLESMDDVAYSLMNCFLNRFTWSIMMESHIDYGEMLPKNIPLNQSRGELIDMLLSRMPEFLPTNFELLA